MLFCRDVTRIVTFRNTSDNISAKRCGIVSIGRLKLGVWPVEF